MFQLPDADQRAMLRTAVLDNVLGGRIYDAHIAEIAHAANADLVLTDNVRHFTGLLRYGIKVLTTAELAQTLR